MYVISQLKPNELMTSSVLEQCAANNQSVEAAKSHKDLHCHSSFQGSTSHHTSEQSVYTAGILLKVRIMDHAAEP